LAPRDEIVDAGVKQPRVRLADRDRFRLGRAGPKTIGAASSIEPDTQQKRRSRKDDAAKKRDERIVVQGVLLTS
jgi:hypothetical protein